MGPTALLPFRRKEGRRAEDFFFTLKNPTASARVWTGELWVLKASRLPLDHRSRCAMLLRHTVFSDPPELRVSSGMLHFAVLLACFYKTVAISKSAQSCVCLSVSPSEWNRIILCWRILLKFYIWEFHENLPTFSCFFYPKKNCLFFFYIWQVLPFIIICSLWGTRWIWSKSCASSSDLNRL
jgi:hypothetical protein